MEAVALEEIQNCVVKLRSNPQRRKNQVYVGCGAGFGGDRPMAALKLLERVEELNYIVLECLAERTLADRYQVMLSGGKGFDPRVKEWLSVLLPLALDREVCIITNMGAIDPPGAQKEILDLASSLGLEITVAVAYESSISGPENSVLSNESMGVAEGRSTYLGAAPIVHCLETYKPHVIITSRVADAALFLAPMVYELGWNWNDFDKLAQGTLASHLLECGCQLTGGYFMHPGDAYRDFSFEQLRDLSLPYAEVSYKGEVCVGKAKGSGGLLSYSTCAEQLLYEVGDPANYITPDLPNGWKGWGEISYGGQECLRRAQAAEYLVRSWMNERYPGIEEKIIAYVMGYDSVKANGGDNDSRHSSKEVIDVRLRMDGLFEQEEHADGFVEEFIALYTNGPAGGGGISTGRKNELTLQKLLIDRENIFWQANAKNSAIPGSLSTNGKKKNRYTGSFAAGIQQRLNTKLDEPAPPVSAPAPSGSEIALYRVAHSRAGDKGNDLNLSIIPHFPDDIGRLRTVITPEWVKGSLSPLLDHSSFPDDRAIEHRNNLLERVAVEIYDVLGISSLNIVVRNILDGGVNCSRRVDRHGKTLSDLILCRKVILPP
ncbi:hypothetical protein CFC21_098367 [Triticum aestivum]|uniref:Uncharacterized protein n=3 Tax=Triticum TaxID=4564 RepID=A0A9R0ZH16_TRITD|nr:hypothetical protein CFC21_098367 [Triticum aestivum]VAI76679.1 unnamed protein product [Triticum turgidum subsp. durum]